jgi:hypothetical protein
LGGGKIFSKNFVVSNFAGITVDPELPSVIGRPTPETTSILATKSPTNEFSQLKLGHNGPLFSAQQIR